MGLSYTHASFVCRYWCASGEQPSGEPVLCLAEVVGRAAHKVEVVARRLRDEKAAGAEEAEELACRLCALLDLATKVDELASARAER